ncbi:MAG: AAA family ATPase [Oscillospiraceae bacterium]
MQDFLFNDMAKNMLAGLFSGGRIPHAILLVGEKGCGKMTFATEIAEKILCTGDIKPCGQCNSCHKVNSGIHPDVVIIGKEDGSQSIKVDAIRKLISEAYISPNDGDYTVVIIREAELLNIASQNALLKLIEEPPAHLVFILTVTNRHSMLDTILSRVVSISVSVPTVKQCYSVLADFVHDKTDEEYHVAAQLSNGNIGIAINLLESDDVTKLYTQVRSLAKTMVIGSEYELLTALYPFEKDRDLLLTVLSLLQGLFVEMLLYKNGVPTEDEDLILLVNRITPLQTKSFIDIIEKVQFMTAQNTDRSVLLSSFCAAIKNATER